MTEDGNGLPATSATTSTLHYSTDVVSRGDKRANLQRSLPQRWGRISTWFTTQTYVPAWLPPVLRHRWASYGAAAIVQVVAALITFQFVALFPTFAVRSALLLLGLAFVALEFGAGPSLVATGVGAFLFDFLLLPPYASFSLVKGASLAGVAIFLVAGFMLVHLAIQRERSRRAARTAMQVMEEFMSIAGHELRAPLAGAMMSMELAHHQLQAAQDRHGNHPTHMEAIAESLELLANTREQLGRQQRLVADLLDVARIQSGGLAMNLQLTDVVALVVESVQETHRIEPARAITVELPVTPIAEVMADPDRLRQVMSNYLSNAIRYSPPATAIQVRVDATDSILVVEVHDKGHGVPSDQQQRIWERYQRASEPPTRSGSSAGLGLGLYISRNIIERHGGHVGMESVPGLGATFWFTLSLAPA